MNWMQMIHTIQEHQQDHHLKKPPPAEFFFCGQTQVDARLIDILGVYAGNPCVPGCHRHQIFSDHPMGVP